MSKKENYYDVVVSVSLTKEQDKKLIKKAKKFDGNKSMVIRNLIDTMPND